jgi:hypothetical protein
MQFSHPNIQYLCPSTFLKVENLPVPNEEDGRLTRKYVMKRTGVKGGQASDPDVFLSQRKTRCRAVPAILRPSQDDRWRRWGRDLPTLLTCSPTTSLTRVYK